MFAQAAPVTIAGSCRMRAEEDGMRIVRAELCGRLARLEAAPAKRFAEDVAGLRRLASVYGLTPVVRLADALERAAAEKGARSLYLSSLRDAIGCEPLDERSADTLLASVSVRFC